MKKLTIIFFMLACLSTLKADAFSLRNIFNRANNLSNNAQTQVLAGDMAAVLYDMQSKTSSVDKQVQDSLIQIASQLSNSTSQTKNLNSRINTLITNSYKTNVEQYNAISNLMSEYTSALRKDKASIASTINNMTDAQKTALVNNVVNLVKSSDEYINIAKVSAERAGKIMKLSNKASEIVTNLNAINTIASEITSRARTTITLANQLRTVAKAAGVTTF